MSQLESAGRQEAGRGVSPFSTLGSLHGLGDPIHTREDNFTEFIKSNADLTQKQLHRHTQHKVYSACPMFSQVDA